MIASSSYAEWTSLGEIRYELRAFKDDHQDTTKDLGSALFSRLEAKYKKNNLSAKFRGFARSDQKDHTRDLFALEEAYLAYQLKKWRFKLGYQLLNWSATEAFHPVDILNSRNFDSNVENAEKLGEFIASAQYRYSGGSLTAMVMPEFISPRYPQQASRLGFGTNIGRGLIKEEEGVSYANDPYTFQGGLVWNQRLGSADLSVQFIHHINRDQPLFTFYNGEVRPVFLPVTQYGVNYQQNIDSWLIKLEAAYRDYENYLVPTTMGGFATNLDHTQIALGLEYNLGFSSGSELTFLLEGQTIPDLGKLERARHSLFQRDLLFGLRYAFNDPMAKEIFASVLGDLEWGHEYLVNMSYSQRLNDYWKIKLGFRYIDAPQKGLFVQGLEYLHGDHEGYFHLSRFF